MSSRQWRYASCVGQTGFLQTCELPAYLPKTYKLPSSSIKLRRIGTADRRLGSARKVGGVVQARLAAMHGSLAAYVGKLGEPR